MDERKNHVLMGAARAMLHDQSLPLFLWIEECSTFFFIQNWSLQCALGYKNTKEMFTAKKKPDIGHFHIFGFPTYSHVNSKKVQSWRIPERGIFVGHDEASNSFLVYLPT